MKNPYFRPQTIRSKALRMVDPASLFRERRMGDFSPTESALLILDMQAYFLSPDSHAFVPSAPAILPGLSALLAAYTAAELPVVFTRHANTPQDAGMMSTWWRDLIAAGDPQSEIAPELDSSLGRVIQKGQYDAFLGTDLESWLRGRGVKQVVIGGVMTHLCCETTARSAFVRGFHVFFLVDGTATYNETFHRATLINLSHGFATPALVDEILDSLSGRR